MNHLITRELVRAILKSPKDLKWSVQGLGMLRTYLSEEIRLHIWDNRLKVPNVSPIHDHPWHLDSHIVAGVLQQRRYEILRSNSVLCSGYEFLNMVTIKCGEGACMKSQPKKVLAKIGRMETYFDGETYHQEKEEVHESMAEPGTVTLVTRTFTPDRDHARVFWRGDGDWVDAAPRPATWLEVKMVTSFALAKWFDHNLTTLEIDGVKDAA